MAQFEKGDEVRLKSGGPVMTVQDIGDFLFGASIEDGVLCVWFEEKEVKEKVFDRTTLVKHEG